MILFIFAGNEDMYKSLNISKFGQMRPLVSMATDRVTVGKNGVVTFSRRFLIGFISYLQLMMIYIRA